MTSIPFPHNTLKPDTIPQTQRVNRAVVDSAKYIVQPDDDFVRPYLAVPNGRAFVWPVGIEGFELTDTPEVGKHKYLGGVGLDVDVTHRGEGQIALSGTFPGWTSQDNLLNLRDIVYAVAPRNGKILYLPGVLDTIQFVVVTTSVFTHAEDERTQDITYSLTMAILSDGAKIKSPTQPGQGDTDNPKRGKRKFQVTSTTNTLRKIAAKVFANPSRWTDLYAIQANAAFFNKRNVPQHNVPDYKLPTTMVVYF